MASDMDKEFDTRDLEAQADSILAQAGEVEEIPVIIEKSHVKSKKATHIDYGCKRIEVTFDRPTGLQVDGEVFEGVTTYVAYVKE